MQKFRPAFKMLFNGLIASLKRRGVSEELIHKALSEVVQSSSAPPK